MVNMVNPAHARVLLQRHEVEARALTQLCEGVVQTGQLLCRCLGTPSRVRTVSRL